jgi:2-iminobutanoate/2-iminopropanoate deaminase
MDVVATDRAPRAIGPYSQAIVAGQHVFTAGQVGLDPATTELVAGGVTEQTERVLKNLAAVLEQAGSGLQSVVKTTVFLADMADFAAMNAVYAEFFPGAKPARYCIQCGLVKPGLLVEIASVAHIG